MAGLTRIHAGLHKCLTMFTRRVYKRACWTNVARPRGFRHFFHDLDRFERERGDWRITSISGHALDPGRYRDARIVRFVRDPRDLIVSGYHYHKRGAEYWCKDRRPSAVRWTIVRGKVPGALPPDTSLEDYLNRVGRAEGMRAELEFRRYHFQSMRDWPEL